MSNITGEDGSFSSGNTGEEVHQQHQKHLQQAPNSTPPPTVTPTNSNGSTSQQQQQPPAKKKRNLPGTPDPNAEVVALSPTTLMATNRFVCEICNKGFQRDQNLQLHRRGHNLPWKLRQRTTAEVRKRVYICPEPSCVHHNPARALGDLTGIKKHYSRKHGEKKWKCDKCSKKYAVQSDWKAHQKTCGTREYKCDCGTIFSRRDSFITHRAFCDALAEENNKLNQAGGLMDPNSLQPQIPELMSANTSMGLSEFNNFDPKNPLKSLPQDLIPIPFKSINMGAAGGMFTTTSGNLFGSPRSIASSSSGLQLSSNTPSPGFNGSAVVPMSATALLQKAAQMGATASNSINSPMMQKSFASSMAGTDHRTSTAPYGALEQQSSITPTSYDSFPTPPTADCGGFSAAMNDIAIYTGMLMSNPSTSNEQNPSAGLIMKNIGEDDDGASFMQGRGAAPPAMSRSNIAAATGDDMMTVDFLGVGGSRPPPQAAAAGPSMHQQQQNNNQQRLEMEAMNQQRIQAMNHPAFHHQQQQHMLHGNSALWDV